MREILFRGKNVWTGEWFYGSLNYFRNVSNNDYTAILPVSAEGENMLKLIQPIDPKTVGQYTGLIDKNGKKIFEGDIVKFINNDKKYKLPVEYKLGQFYIGFNMPVAYIRFSCEVIGNIHDNHELLEE